MSLNNLCRGQSDWAKRRALPARRIILVERERLLMD
jgi:hypothetical protein